LADLVSASVVALSSGQLRRRRDRIQDYLDVWGDLAVNDVGASTDRRLIEFILDAPGHDLQDEALLRYREYYRLTEGGEWLLAKYTYEFIDLVHERRLAYHLHDIDRRRLVPHAHCESVESLDDAESPHHLRAVELELREAHTVFMRLYASGNPPDCEAFLPLEVPRGFED
jgi:hypothetical protein